jgi:lipopolysaccharide/colanic/teichoic acid biosynthesis glycosyltransferase
MQEVISDSNWFSLTSTSQQKQDATSYYQLKRILDVTIVLFSLILLLPLLFAIGILIKLDSSGPAIFVQECVGAKKVKINGRTQWIVQTFPFFKFRTMRTDIDSKLHEEYMKAYIAGDESKLAEQEGKSTTSYKLTGDPRVTRVGKFLRATSLDELPQLWNVLRGEMSLVGPRPPIPYEVEVYNKEHFRRFGTLPGITGLWQVSGRCETTFEEMVQLDLEYIEMKSIWQDIKILLLTIPAVISERGAG